MLLGQTIWIAQNHPSTVTLIDTHFPRSRLFPPSGQQHGTPNRATAPERHTNQRSVNHGPEKVAAIGSNILTTDGTRPKNSLRSSAQYAR